MDVLDELEFTTYEKKVYMTLLQYGDLKSSVLAKKSGVPQSKLYEVGERLVEKGFVCVLEIRPKKFSAIDPKVAVASFVEEKQKELQRVLKAASSLQKKKVEVSTDEVIQVYKGRKDLTPVLLQKYSRAEKCVKDMFSFEFFPSSVLREMVSCRERGVKIYLLGTTEKKMQAMRKMARLGFKVRYYPVEEMRLTVTDSCEAHQFFTKGDERIAVRVRSQELSRVLEHYFDYVWRKAKKVKVGSF